MSHVESIADLERILDTIQKEVQAISVKVDNARAVLIRLQNVEIAEVAPHYGTLSERNSKFSHAARFAIEKAEGPLKAKHLEKFLMEEAFGKPNPDILRIVRQYTPSVEGLIEQLNYVKDMNNRSHIHYREEQRMLDVNLNKKIDTLVANMTKELEKEATEGRSQTSIDTAQRGIWRM